MRQKDNVTNVMIFLKNITTGFVRTKCLKSSIYIFLRDKLNLVGCRRLQMHNFGKSSKVYNQMFCIDEQKHLQNINAILNSIALFTNKLYLNVPVKQLNVV